MNARFALEVYNPCGTVQVANVHAPRLGTLSGKTICEVSDGVWETARTFPKIRELLQKRFPDMKIVPYTTFPSGNFDVEDIGERVKAQKCDGAIVGNAA
jgi:hypothetical protein